MRTVEEKRQYDKEWKLNNRERHLTSLTKWRLNNPERFKSQLRKCMYHLSEEHFQKMLIEQEHRCAICFAVFTEENPPCVDHDHRCCSKKAKSCGKCIRGLLCGACNHGLGKFREDVQNLSNAIKYVEKWNVRYNSSSGS
jgi:hypothetical protein